MAVLKYWDGAQYVPVMGGAGGGGDYISVEGGTMTGVLTLSGDPVNPLDAATKQYVDNSAGGVTIASVPPTEPPAKDGLIWIVVV